MNWFSSEQNYPKLCISRPLKPKKANWSNQRNLFVVHTGRHSNKTSMWTIYKKHDYECSRMQLDFDKKKKCWCIYRSLELENIFSQISTYSPPHVVHSQCLCILRGTCVCARTDATNWVPGSEKWLRPKSGPCQPAQWSCFFLQFFFVPLLPKTSLSSSGVWLQINLFSGKRRCSSHATLCQHATHRP